MKDNMATANLSQQSLKHNESVQPKDQAGRDTTGQQPTTASLHARGVDAIPGPPKPSTTLEQSLAAELETIQQAIAAGASTQELRLEIQSLLAHRR